MNYKEERMRMGLVAGLAILIMELILFGGLGISVPIVIVAFYTAVAVQYRKQGTICNIFKQGLFIPIVLITLSYALFSNEVLKVFNSVLLVILMTLQLSELFGMNTYERYSLRWLLRIIPLDIIMPFESLTKAIRSVKSDEESSGKARRWQTMSKIAIGCVAGIPILIVAGVILMEADAAFEGMIQYMFGYIHFDFSWIIIRLIVFSIIFFPLIGFFYGMTHHYETELRIKYNEDMTNKKWGIDFTIAMTISTLLGLLYLLYCVAQLSYFISAFKGILPADYTYAEYARRGFFEMLPIAFLNIGVITGLNLLTADREDAKKAKGIRGYTFFFIGFTLFIVLTALSKMVMYMGMYGLTLKRVYVTWFLILCIISLMLIGCKICMRKIKLMKSLFIAFVAMYIGLNYMNVDYQVARYNADLYAEKGINTIDSFYDLSLSSVEPFLEMGPSSDENYNYVLESYNWSIENMQKWQHWNLSYDRAAKLLK